VWWIPTTSDHHAEPEIRLKAASGNGNAEFLGSFEVVTELADGPFEIGCSQIR
jgi:hypothetical protein